MKPRFSFSLLPLALLPLTLVPQAIQGQCPCSSIPIPSSMGPESLRKKGCLKPAFRDFTVEYEADPNPEASTGGNPNLSVKVGDIEVHLVPGEKKRVRVSDASAAPGPVSGEKVPVSATAAPGQMYQMPTHAKVKVNTGGDSKSNNSCTKPVTGEAAPPPDKNTELSGGSPSKEIQNGGPQQDGSGSLPNSSNGGGNDPSQQGRGDACTDSGQLTRGPNNTFLDVPPRMLVTKTLGLNLNSSSLAGVLVWDSTKALDPSQASNYKVRGTDSATSVYPNSGTIEKILAHDGLMVLEQSTTTKLTISNYKKNQFDSQSPPVVTQGEISFRTTAVEKLLSLTVNPPLPVDGQAWSGSGMTNVIGHTITESEGGVQTQQRTVWTGTLLSGSITHYYTSEEILIQNGPARRILQTHSSHTANSEFRTLTSIEILQPTGIAASGVTASKVTETLQLFEWGEEVIARTIDPAGANLTTQYRYHDTVGTPDYGWLKIQTNPDGSWQGHWIEAGAGPGELISHSIEPWKDTPATPAVTISRSDLITLANQGRHTITTISGPDNTLTEMFVLGTQTALSSSWMDSHPTTGALISTTSRVYADGTTYRENSFIIGTGVREENYVTPQASTPISTSTTNSLRMQYPAGNSLNNPPITRLDVPYTQGPETAAISFVSSTSDNPPIVSHYWTDKASGLLLASERLLGTHSLGYKRYTYDTKGRQIQEILMADGLEITTGSTAYDDTALTMSETDVAGTVSKSTYDAFGRIIEQRRLGVAATAGTQSTGSGTLAAGQAQNDIVTIYSYAARPAVGGVVPLGWVETVTEKAVAINSPATSAALTGHSRTTSRTTDGAGRVISSTDVLGKILTTTYANVAGSGLKTTTKFGATTIHESANYLDGQAKSLTGVSVVAENYDYAVGSFTTSTIVSHPGFPATDKITTTRDGLDRTVSVTAPSGVTAAGVTFFTSVLTYGDDGRLATRSHCDTEGNPYFEFFTYTNNGQTLTNGLRDGNNMVTNVRTTDVTYGYGDIGNSDNFCFSSITTSQGGAVLSVKKQALHERIFSSGGAVGLLTSLSGHERYCENSPTGGKKLSWQNSTAIFPSIHATQSISSSDGTSSLVSEYYNGQLNALSSSAYTAPQVVQHNPLGESLRETSASSIYWPWIGIEPTTGLVVSRALPSNAATTVETYTYYRYNDNPPDLNIGRLKSRVSLRSPTSTTYFKYNERGQLLKQWGGGDFPLSYEYDSQGRMTKMNTFRSDLGFSTATWPTSADTVSPPPGGRATTQWVYPNSAFLNLVTQKFYQGVATPLAYTYWHNGALNTRIWQRGVTTTYTYDSFSRLTDLGYTGGSVTTPPVHFEYYADGRLALRTDAAGATQTNYTLDGQVTAQYLVEPGSSNDISTVLHTYDALGRQQTMDAKWYGPVIGETQAVHSAQTVTYSYDDAGDRPSSRFLGLNVSGQELPSRYYAVTYQSGGDVPGQQYWNDDGGSPANASGFTLSRSSTANADGLPENLSHVAHGATTNQIVQSFGHIYDKDRVTKTTREGDDTWKYAYDAKSQVASARKDLGPDPSAAVFAGTQATYSYDQIGNRTTAQQGGGSTVGTGMRSITYTSTDLNQIYYAYRSSYVDFLGKRESTDNSVNFYINQSTTPVTLGAGDYQGAAPNANLFWRKELMTSYSANYTKVKITENPPASGGTTPPPYPIEEGFVYNPYYQSYSYDADGNVTGDGRWTYVWDAENRLASMTCPATTIMVYSGYTYVSIPVPGYRLTYTYDGLSRRIRKLVERNLTSSPSGYQILNHEGYLYDGWNLIMTVRFDDASSNNPPVRGRVASYVWGPDIGSSPYAGRNWQGAGGVGGLLMIIDDANTSALYSATSTPAELAADTTTNTTDTYFPLTDRMGNITGYRRSIPGVEFNQLALTGAVLEYDAFGKEIRSTGPAADRVPFHFSSKFLDAETGLNYYGYRYYDSGNGRWLGRDPIGEDGGTNLYAILRNDAENAFDALGMQMIFEVPVLPPMSFPRLIPAPPAIPTPRITQAPPSPSYEIPPTLPPVVPSGSLPSGASPSPVPVLDPNYDPPTTNPLYQDQPTDTAEKKAWKRQHRACDEPMDNKLKQGRKEDVCAYWQHRLAKYERCLKLRQDYLDNFDTPGSIDYEKHKAAIERLKREQKPQIDKGIKNHCPQPKCYPGHYGLDTPSA